MVQKKPKGKLTYKDNMEKRFNITLQGYVNKVAGMVKACMIPVDNDDILHRLILVKTKSGDVIKD